MLEAVYNDVPHAQRIYRSQLSRQRLYVPCATPMEEGTAVVLCLKLKAPSSVLELNATVFRSISAEIAQKHSLGEVAGVVLSVPLIESVKQPLRAFLTGKGSLAKPRRRRRTTRNKLTGAALTAQVQAFVERTDDVTHYEVLDIGPSAPEKEVRRSYLVLMRTYHPDNYFQRVDDATQALLEIAFQRINDAFQTLIERKTRDRYDIEIGNLATTAGGSSEAFKRQRQELLEYRRVNKDKLKKARELWEGAQDDESAGRFKSARSKLKLAINFDPRNPLFKRKLNELEGK